MKEKKKTTKPDTRFETSKEINAKDISWELFKQTGDTKYYRLFSALKGNKEK